MPGMSLPLVWALVDVFQVRQGKWAEALEVLGEENPFRDVG
jgi:hypothetical protein